MMKIVEVTLPEMLEARERRVIRQRELLEKYHMPLVSFTMNIAGPVKDSPLIRGGFRVGDAMLKGQFARMKSKLVFSEKREAPTGCEAFYVVDMEARALKQITEELEDGTDLGRLFDMDVLFPDSANPSGVGKLDRAVPRRCLICGEDAKICASRRLHTVTELRSKSREILKNALDRRDRETAGNLACRALLYEVCVTPKPGLVDRANNGSHADMDLYTFLRSSAALWPYFAECARIGRECADQNQSARETFDALRVPGKMAEIAMLRATAGPDHPDGVNTHKGAIFSMGLACAALGRLNREDWRSPEKILSEIADLTRGLSERDFADLTEENAHTTGQKLYTRYGIAGIRGQAEAGFPVVLKYGLPVLENGLAMGKSPDEAGAAAMLTMLSHTVDTNMIARGGIAVQEEIAARIAGMLERNPYPDKITLNQLDQDFTRSNLSPGGSADLLALCWFLRFSREEEL